MIRQIIYKEVLENLLSLRFGLSVLLAISLFVICGYVFVINYQEQSKDYWKKTNENLSAVREESSELYKVAFYKQGIYRKPQPLVMCAEGEEKALPNFFQVNAFTADLPKTKGQANFALPQFSSVDWGLIVSLILSFAALVFTYDSICGEREAGTLRLTLANTIPRHEVLLGKYAGTMITLAIPMILGMLVSVIILIPSKDVVIGGSGWVKILVVAFVSLLYLSIFVLLGMFVSSRTGHSANSMAILLLAWVVAVILLPSFARIVFDVSVEEPTEQELQRQINEAREEIWDNSERYGKNAGSMSNDLSNPINNPPARARLQAAVMDATNQLQQEYHTKWLGQAIARRNFACLSPAVIYQRACEAVAGTGIMRCADLYKQVKRYGMDLKEFVRSRDTEDPQSLHLIGPTSNMARSWRTISHDPVDFDSIPKFQEHPMTLGQSLRLAVWDIGLLILINLGLFAGAFVSFLRYDVR
ncbi:MAG: ABC transporter permease subunit [Sedimentisphaerales bacterium]|jgi:ABC-type transport system involved in multi-copper enzyme maturation permease subunit